MDAVNAFNVELFSMIDMKPPISRAKMMSITKSAIKAIKLYKHVVQIVEKFIKKCKPDLKVPGLYVVDSIIRQSRHQFGVDKDMFGPRFLKNFAGTFQNLYLCPTEDKSKILRVLNLWQKNGVFDMDIIQPLLDMAAGSDPDMGNGSTFGESPLNQVQSHPPVMSNSIVAALPQLQNSDALAAVAQLFQSSQGHELQKILQSFQQGEKSQAPVLENNISAHLQMSAAPHNPHLLDQKSLLAKKLLDRFDYDDEPEDVRRDETPSVFSHLGVGENAYNQFHAQISNMENFQHQMSRGDQAPAHQMYSGMMQGGEDMTGAPQTISGSYPALNEAYNQQHLDSSREGDPSIRADGKHRAQGRKSRSHSGSRSPKRRRSRSPSRSQRSRTRRSRSRSKDRRWQSPRSRSEERKDRERERERRQKGLPPIKSHTLSVCSTTLWVGQLDKKTQQQDVTSLLEEFGQIESVNMIPPRGCAYIVMVHRQDAYRALQKLSRGSFKVNQKAIKIAWALNKGITAAYKQHWDVERGVTYIPWSKVKPEDLDSFREGGTLDIETVCPEWISSLKDTGSENRPRKIQAEEPATAPVQVTLVQQVGPTGEPPAFTAHMGLLPPSFPPGGPPPPFMPAGFNPTQMPPGFPPPVVLPSIGSTGPPPIGPGNTKEEASKDSFGGNVASSSMIPDNHMDPQGGPGMSPQIPGGLLGTRPGVMPLQRPPGPPPPHLQHFAPHSHHPPMPPQMMRRGPGQMFPREPPPYRLRIPMSHPRDGFPPHGPPFMPEPPMGPEDMGDWKGGPFRNERLGFGNRWFGERPTFPRGGGGNGWMREGPEGRDPFMNHHERFV